MERFGWFGWFGLVWFGFGFWCRLVGHGRTGHVNYVSPGDGAAVRRCKELKNTRKEFVLKADAQPFRPGGHPEYSGRAFSEATVLSQ